MTRPACLGLLVALSFAVPPVAGAPATSPSVERAMVAAREHLRDGRAAAAVAVLEAELLNAGGSGPFLTLLREAYTADLRDLQARKADAAAIDSVRRRLQALDGKAVPGPSAAPVSGAAADIHAPAPPIPEPPADPVAAGALGPAPAAAGVAPPSEAGDPFQQPLRQPGAASLPRASEAFAARRYAEAARLFADAAGAGESFSPAQRDEWAYSRLHGVAMRLNKTEGAAADLAGLAREVDEALKAGSEHLAPFGNQLRAEIRRRSPGAGTSPVESGWEVVQTGNFRVLHHGQPGPAAEVAGTAEAARTAMYDRWAGGPAAAWVPRCDIYLYSAAADYAKATGKTAESPGHSTVGIAAGRVVSRRIDVRLDEPTALDAVLPSEVTQVVLADLFADQPLPRWALVGMAALSESPEEVGRFQRAVPDLLRQKKLFAVGPFLDQAKFPDAGAVTAFYVESVSLVAFLVERKGPKAFATFLREAPRRGYGRALVSHYGFKDAADLQDQWVKHVLGAE